MPWSPLPLPDLTDAPPAIRPYLEDLAGTYATLAELPTGRGKNLGKPTAAEAPDLLTAAAQVIRRVDEGGAGIVTDLARQLRRATTTGGAYDVCVEATATLVGIIAALSSDPDRSYRCHDGLCDLLLGSVAYLLLGACSRARVLGYVPWRCYTTPGMTDEAEPEVPAPNPPTEMPPAMAETKARLGRSEELRTKLVDPHEACG